VLNALALCAGAASAETLTRKDQCVTTTIKEVTHRRIDEIGRPIEDSGSAVIFANDLYQVSYEESTVVKSWRAGDPVRICLIRLPRPPGARHCPPGDDRGGIYKTTNNRTHTWWSAPNAQSPCGSA